jgi:hypothetical protein
LASLAFPNWQACDEGPSRRERLAWTLRPPITPDGLAELVREDLNLKPFGLPELCRRQTPWLQYLLEAEVMRLVRLLEVPALLMCRPGWERWEVARWALATCLARISQLVEALEQRQGGAPAHAMLNAALEVAWQRLTTSRRQDAA